VLRRQRKLSVSLCVFRAPLQLAAAVIITRRSQRKLPKRSIAGPANRQYSVDAQLALACLYDYGNAVNR
jgi:hypothetical protein